MTLPEVLNDDTYYIAGIHEHRTVRSGKRVKYEYFCGYNDDDPASRAWEKEADVAKQCPQLLQSYKRSHHI